MNFFDNKIICFLLFLTISCFLTTALVAQPIYVPTNHIVYDFLKRMEARQLVTDYRDAVKPLSRSIIASQLAKLEPIRAKLTPNEQEVFRFLKEEFQFELARIDSSFASVEPRAHLYTLELYDGFASFDLALKLTRKQEEKKNLTQESRGMQFYGYIFKNIGFYFNFTDNSERGNNIDLERKYTPEPGFILSKQTKDHFEYDATLVQFSYQLGPIDISVENFENMWSLGHKGSLTFSRKSPPAPQLKIRFAVNDWIDFTYIHAQLKSNIIDSARSYHAGSSAIKDFYRPVDRDKYLAAHMFEISLIKGIDFSFGESVVYTDKDVQWLYTIPLMFFKSGEHYNRDTDNTQFFGNLDINIIPDINIYSSIYIDEFIPLEIFNPTKARNQLGYTVGLQTFDFGLENLELLAEYSHLNPWVYSHKYPAATFTNNSFDMGHWIGQNADDLYLEASYQPMWWIRTGLYFERFRKGGKTDVGYQYKTPSLDFLYGGIRTEQSIGIFGIGQPFRDLFVNAKLRLVKLDDENKPANNHNFKPEFTFTVSYGVW